MHDHVDLYVHTHLHAYMQSNRPTSTRIFRYKCLCTYANVHMYGDKRIVRNHMTSAPFITWPKTVNKIQPSFHVRGRGKPG